MRVLQLKEAAALRVKGKLGLASSGSMGSKRFSGALMRQLTMSPGGSTWQVGSWVAAAAGCTAEGTVTRMQVPAGCVSCLINSRWGPHKTLNKNSWWGATAGHR